MRTNEFHYHLPPELIAQSPAPQRDASRLLHLVRHPSSPSTHHRQFSDLPHLIPPQSLLILNNSKVIPARLHARDPRTGGHFELLLLESTSPFEWWCMMRPGKRATPGKTLELIPPQSLSSPPTVTLEILTFNDDGHRHVRFHGSTDIFATLESFGEIPLPPYIERTATSTERDSDRERYQTVYAREPGSVAAPTAGLHFTPRILSELSERGVAIHHVTLHVGAGTFTPVKSEHIENHRMHAENYSVPASTAEAVNRAKKEGRPVIAVGTTSLRVLESAVEGSGALQSGNGRTRIFIHPPYTFQIVDQLITNFHLPESTLLMLVSALASPGKTDGREIILKAYAEAIEKRYRFFSYGDAMWIQ